MSPSSREGIVCMPSRCWCRGAVESSIFPPRQLGPTHRRQAVSYAELQTEPVNGMAFRDALSKAVTPVTVVATDGPHGSAGVTCSAVSSVSDTPPTVLVCINRRSAANAIIKANGVLSVNWLRADQIGMSQLFSGAGGVPMQERFDHHDWTTLATGAPCSTGALVALDCRIAEAVEAGTHAV